MLNRHKHQTSERASAVQNGCVCLASVRVRVFVWVYILKLIECVCVCMNFISIYGDMVCMCCYTFGGCSVVVFVFLSFSLPLSSRDYMYILSMKWCCCCCCRCLLPLKEYITQFTSFISQAFYNTSQRQTTINTTRIHAQMHPSNEQKREKNQGIPCINNNTHRSSLLNGSGTLSLSRTHIDKQAPKDV